MSFPAPVALFVYNRPEHTRRTLESLAANSLAAQTTLVVYSDGARAGEEEAIAAVRAVVRERAWCGEVRLVEATGNRGLARQIVEGVTERLQEAEALIVLEDDLVLSPGFLAYMNDALELYRDEPRVMQVAGFLVELPVPRPETFFVRTASSWGWATWRRAWSALRLDGPALLREIERSGRRREFNFDGAHDFLIQLRLNVTGHLQTWAIFWYASIFLADGLVLHPGRSLVRNIGHDESGTHSRPDERYEVEELAAKVVVERIPLVADDAMRAAMRARYQALPEGWWRRLRTWWAGRS